MEPLRIGMVETSAHGGLLHYAAQLADALADRGHDVELLVPRGNELDGRSGRARRRAILLPPTRPDRPVPRQPARYLLRRAGVAARLTASAARVIAECRRQRYDALVLQWDVTLAPVALAHRVLRAVVPGSTIGYVLHNVQRLDDQTSPEPRQRMRRTLERVDTVFVHGDRSLEEYRALWPPRPVTVIPFGDWGILAEELPPATEERILFFGDWRKYKGLPLLMEAFDELAAHRPEARLTIAGTPAPADFDDRLVHDWARGHGDRVELVPRYVPIGEVPDLFARARVVATPYTAGYQSGVLHLAMTAGRPVVTSDVGDLGSVIDHGRTGLVVPPGDCGALVDALGTVLADAELAGAMGRAARRKVELVSGWATVAAAVEDSLAAQRRSAS